MAPYPDAWPAARPTPLPPYGGERVSVEKRREIVDLLRQGAFASLEEEFASLRASVERDVRGEDRLVDSYRSFGGPDTDLLDRLDEWVAAYGGRSATPYVARAWFWWARAEEMERERTRMGDDAEVMSARDEAFRRGLADARRAVALDPGDLGAHVALLELDGIYRTSESTREIVDAALERFPASYRIRAEAVARMRPIVGGSLEAMQHRIDASQAHVGANPRLAELRGAVALEQAIRLREQREFAGALAKLDEAEALGASGWVHHHRALTWYLAADPARALSAANLAVAHLPTAWQVLDVRARILAWIATFAKLGQREGLLAHALADQDDALALQPWSYRGLEQRARIAAYHAECAHSRLRCFRHSAVTTEEPAGDVSDPESGWVRLLMFVLGIPLTLLLVLVEGERLYLLPLPLVALWSIGWNFVPWRRQGYWVPRSVHVLAVVALVMIVGINVAWVRAGGGMWTQRYVVIVVCTIVPYFLYLVLGGPRRMARLGRVPPSRTTQDR